MEDNRNARRQKERREKTLTAWLKSLDADKKKLLEQIILKQIEKNDETTSLILDKCFLAAISDNVDLELEDLNKIIVEANHYMEEMKNYLENEGDLKMIADLKPQIEKEMLVMIKEKKNKVEGVKELRAKYKVPQNELVSMWVDLKEKKKIGTTNSHTPGKYKKEIPYVVTEKDIETSREKLVDFNGVMINEKDLESAKEVMAEIKAPSTLKIKSVVVEGKFGTYTKNQDGVRIGNKLYIDITSVEKGNESLQATTNTKREELLSYIAEAYKKISELEECAKRESEILAEINQVFNI